MKTTVLSQQSLFDIAIQTSGDASAAFELALKNDISLTDDLTMGQELIFAAVFEKPIYNYYKNRELKPATGLTEEVWNDFDSDRIFDYTFNDKFN